MPNNALSLFIAGDMLMSRPWIEWQNPSFQALVSEIKRADVAAANLETVIHQFRGYAQADSGGAYTAAPPQVAADLARCGINMVATANNHSYDYGSTGVLETLENLDAACIISAGTGPDLQSAEAPAYFNTAGQTVALVAMTASFHSYNRASLSRPDLHGRPGVNPLTLAKGLAIRCPRAVFRSISEKPGAKRRQYLDTVKWRGIDWTAGEHYGIETRRRIVSSDAERVLRNVRLASASAELTLVSIHSHNERRWLKQWCRKLIRSGADIVFVHGKHQVGGVEIFEGRPIFYGLGDFVFQPHLLDRMPAEAFERVGLPFDAPPQDYHDIHGNGGSAGRKAYEGAVATLVWRDGRPEEIKLIPVDLQYDAEPDITGSPRRGDAVFGERIIRQMAAASRRYGTSIRFDRHEVCGHIELRSPK